MTVTPLNPQEPVSELEGNAAELLRRLREAKRPVTLTENGKNAAVLLDFDTYQDLLEEIETLQDVINGLVAMQEGRVSSHEEVRARLLARFSTDT
jgi:prevent-host-death family protein